MVPGGIGGEQDAGRNVQGLVQHAPAANPAVRDERIGEKEERCPEPTSDLQECAQAITRKSAAPCHFQSIADGGPCRKARVVMQHRPPLPEAAQMGFTK